MNNQHFFDFKDFELTISATAKNLIFKAVGKSCNTTWENIVDRASYFPFFEDSIEALEITNLCIKEGSVTIDQSEEEKIVIGLEYNLYYKKKKVSIILRRNLDKSILVDSINFCKNRIDLVYKEFNVRFRELKNLYDDEILSLNNYCREMFAYITGSLDGLTKTINKVDNSTKNNIFALEALDKRLSYIESQMENIDLPDIENIGYIRYKTQTWKKTNKITQSESL
jgi:hypothetical protein